jgi:rhodanese-related sulfurtransferase
MSTNSLPEIDVQTLARKLRSGEAFIVLDVREPWELERARLADPQVETAPMSALARQGISALPESARSPEAEIYVLCHHGNRSAQVTAWLAQQGWNAVYNIRGGIDAYAAEVDDSVGFY